MSEAVTGEVAAGFNPAAAAPVAVALAEIEARRDVEIAEIHEAATLETTALVVEASKNVADDKEDDLEWLRTELRGLRERCEQTTNENTILLQRMAAAETILTLLSERMAETAEQLAMMENIMTASLMPPPPLNPPPPENPDVHPDRNQEAASEAASDSAPALQPPQETRRKRVWL